MIRWIIIAKKAIIFIPGIGGSNLYCGPPSNKQIYLTKGFLLDGISTFVYDDWEESDYDTFKSVTFPAAPLYANEMIREEDINFGPELTTFITSITPPPLIPQIPLLYRPIYVQKGYDNVMKFFKSKEWSIRRFENNWKLPDGDSVNQPAFYELPYDWREDIECNVISNLYSMINDSRLDIFNRDIYLIGHSTGGLVSRSFLRTVVNNDRLSNDCGPNHYANNNRQNILNRIKGQILIGVPNHGAPKAYWVLRSGKGFLDYKNPLLSKLPPNMNELCKNLPLPYQLLPSKYYENFFVKGPAYGPIVTVKGLPATTIESTYYANQPTIRNMTPQKALKWYSLNNDSLVRRALSFHADLGLDTYLPGKTYVIYSSEIETLTGVDFRKNDDGEPRLDDVGDGTVPAASVYDLNGIGKATSGNLFSKDFKDIEHTDLPIDEKVLEYVLKIINI